MKGRTLALAQFSFQSICGILLLYTWMETGRGNLLLTILILFSALPVALFIGKSWDWLSKDYVKEAKK
jgi:hypothetical protein